MVVRHWGGYVSVDWDCDGDNIEPLLWCLRFLIVDHLPLDYWLSRIFPAIEKRYAGGDPGWEITNVDLDTGDMLYDPSGKIIYRVWIDEDISYLESGVGIYEEAIIKYHVRRTLENFRAINPASSSEIDALVLKYGLDYSI
jgi:hypothetical protein